MQTQSLASYMRRKYRKEITTAKQNTPSRQPQVAVAERIVPHPRIVNLSRRSTPNRYDNMRPNATRSSKSFKERAITYKQRRQSNLRFVLESLDDQLRSIEDTYKIEFKNPAVQQFLRISKSEYDKAIRKWQLGLRIEGNTHADRAVMMKIDGVLNAYRRVAQWKIIGAREAIEKKHRWSLPIQLTVMFDNAIKSYNNGMELQLKGLGDRAKSAYEKAIQLGIETTRNAKKR